MAMYIKMHAGFANHFGKSACLAFMVYVILKDYCVPINKNKV